MTAREQEQEFTGRVQPSNTSSRLGLLLKPTCLGMSTVFVVIIAIIAIIADSGLLFAVRRDYLEVFLGGPQPRTPFQEAPRLISASKLMCHPGSNSSTQSILGQSKAQLPDVRDTTVMNLSNQVA